MSTFSTVETWLRIGRRNRSRRLAGPGSDPFTIIGEAVRLSREGSTAMALGLHELCTNAIKYGALSVPVGRVGITWTVEERMLRLTWRETGGPAVAPIGRRGFGTRLLQRGLLTGDAGSVSLSFERGGVVCVMVAQLEAS